MGTLNKKIDFACIISVKNANPNGDPLNGNRPRETNDGFGEISDVCIKRKLRNRLQDMGKRIFVQSDDRADDGYGSLRERAESSAALKKAEKAKDRNQYATIACETWADVRAFGQVFAFTGKKKDDGSDKEGGVSVGVRGPVSIHPAIGVLPIEIESMQITKSVNSESAEKRSSDTMGSKHRIGFGVYRFNGSINCQLAEKTGFSEQDAENIREALCTLFENDTSAARPDGSMEVCRVYWWQHNCKAGQYSSAKVHGSLRIEPPNAGNPKSFDDSWIALSKLDGLEPTIYEGR